jgi:hypothetical protein
MGEPDDARRQVPPGLSMRGNHVSNSGGVGIRVNVPETMRIEISDSRVDRVAGDGISVTARPAEELAAAVVRAGLTPEERLLLGKVLEEAVGTTTADAAAVAQPRSNRVAKVLTEVATTVISSTLAGVVSLQLTQLGL